MADIFDEDPDSNLEISTKNEFAKNYETWRKKEVLNKLKTKYGEEVLGHSDDDDESSSSSDDEDGVELTEEVEREFFKTLSCLKTKDPRIYDENVRFFNSTSAESSQPKKKKKKEKPVTVRDYEMKFNNESEEEYTEPRSPGSVEDKDLLRFDVDDDEDDDDAEIGGIMTVRQKTEEEKLKEENDLKGYLEHWNDPNLPEGEKFLRDFILEKKYISNDDKDYIPTYDELVGDPEELIEEEDILEKQEEFEHKYNFRFEEPDQEFIKRYPRTMESSLRKTDDRRKVKRAEIKERKQKEKEEELKQFQELNRKAIEEKIAKLKEIAGDADIAFNDKDIEEDFDPEAYDKRMQSVFNDEFYHCQEEDQKPECPEVDDCLEIEEWDRWDGNDKETQEDEEEEHTPHCEDDEFNMDCDYDSKATTQNELIENTRGKKKRKRKSLFAKVANQPKPIFDPNDKNFDQYMDEFYKLDCEDIVGGKPFKFPYRDVVPNSFGLTMEELLGAKTRELNRWCSLKKAVQYNRTENDEKNDRMAFERKAQNPVLKKRILPSLFEREDENNKIDDGSGSKGGRKIKNAETSAVVVKGVIERSGVETDVKDTIKDEKEFGGENSEKSNSVELNTQSKKKKKKKTKNKQNKDAEVEPTYKEVDEHAPGAEKIVEANVQNKKKKKKKKQNKDVTNETKSTQEKVEPGGEKKDSVGENGLKKKKKKNKKKQRNKDATGESKPTDEKTQKKRKRKLSENGNGEVPSKKSKNSKFNRKAAGGDISISDARLSAYGINPKKFKNKLKYGKKSQTT